MGHYIQSVWWMFYSSVYIKSKILKIALLSQNFRLTWPELVFFFIFVLRVLFLRNKNTINQTSRTLPCPPSVSSHNFRTIIGRNFTFWYVVGSSYETEAKIIWRHDNVHTLRTISHFIPTMSHIAIKNIQVYISELSGVVIFCEVKYYWTYNKTLSMLCNVYFLFTGA